MGEKIRQDLNYNTTNGFNDKTNYPLFVNTFGRMTLYKLVWFKHTPSDSPATTSFGAWIPEATRIKAFVLQFRSGLVLSCESEKVCSVHISEEQTAIWSNHLVKSCFSEQNKNSSCSCVFLSITPLSDWTIFLFRTDLNNVLLMQPFPFISLCMIVLVLADNVQP